MKEITVDKLLSRIYFANDNEIKSIINATAERFSEIWPEWELLILSVHGHDRESHINALQKSADLLKSQE